MFLNRKAALAWRESEHAETRCNRASLEYRDTGLGPLEEFRYVQTAFASYNISSDASRCIVLYLRLAALAKVVALLAEISARQEWYTPWLNSFCERR
jgi:hypothetical protein